MVKHIVLWKIREDAQKQANIDHMIEMLTSLVGKIEGLVSMEMGYNFNSDSEYDVVLYSTFKNVAALKYYQTHPEHIKCKEFIQSVAVGRTSADYFFEEGIRSSRPFDEVPDAPEEEPIYPNKVVSPTAPAAAPMNINEAPPASPTKFDDTPAPAPMKFDDTPAPAPMKFYDTPAPAPMKFDDTPALAPMKFDDTPAPAPMKFDDTPAPAPMKFEDTPAPAPMKFEDNPAPAPMKFEDTPAPAPMKFDDTPAPAPMKFDDTPAPAPMKFDDTPAPAPMKFEDTPSAAKPEGRSSFFSRKNRQETENEPVKTAPSPSAPPPAAAGANTWTCPACGKVMPNYVGTCGCGEPKPFSFDDVPPALQDDPHDAAAIKAAGSAYPDMKAKASKMSSPSRNASPAKNTAPSPSAPPPAAAGANTWTCPACGKVMPNYVGTCGCGEPKPFSFDDVPPALQDDPHDAAAIKAAGSAYPDMKAKASKMSSPSRNASPAADEPQTTGFRNRKRRTATDSGSTGSMPPVGKNNDDEEDDFIMDDGDFNQAAPSIQSYTPQTSVDNNDSTEQAKMPFGSDSGSMPAFGFDDEPAPAPMRFDDAPPPAPMRFDDAPPPAPMRFDDAPPPAPMRFDDAPPPAPMRFDDAPPPAPMRFNSSPAPAPAPAPAKQEKKSFFGGRKARESEVMRLAEEKVQNRRDVPGAGSTWTCPACGKVMPKYVGTCGCGESQPFEF